MEPSGGTSLSARRHVTDQPSFWVLFELPGGDELPPGNANCFRSILGFSGFWAILDQWKEF